MPVVGEGRVSERSIESQRSLVIPHPTRRTFETRPKAKDDVEKVDRADKDDKEIVKVERAILVCEESGVGHARDKGDAGWG